MTPKLKTLNPDNANESGESKSGQEEGEEEGAGYLDAGGFCEAFGKLHRQALARLGHGDRWLWREGGKNQQVTERMPCTQPHSPSFLLPPPL